MDILDWLEAVAQAQDMAAGGKPQVERIERTAAREIVKLRAELEECKRDAERYRWLRERIENDDFLIARASEWCLTSWCEDDPDRYIDAILAAKEE